MTIKDQLTAVQSALETWAENEGGRAYIASDRVHLYDLIGLSQGKPTVVALFMGETIRGEFEVAAALGRVDRQFLAVISRGRGMKANPADSLVQDGGGGKPMFELVESVRDIIRTLELDPDTTERPIDYKGIAPVDFGENTRTDAYQIEFSIGTALPVVGSQADT